MRVLAVLASAVLAGGATTAAAAAPAASAMTAKAAAGAGYSAVAAWGDNRRGQSTVPAGLDHVTAIAAGYDHNLVLKDDGTVVAWGNNDQGQTAVPRGLDHVTAIAAGYLHNLALKGDGTVVAWGYNLEGQTAVPVGLDHVTAIGAGNFYSLALKDDGTVVVWGGMHDPPITDVPVGLDHVVAIAAGGYVSLALKDDGTVVAWGDDFGGAADVPVGLDHVVAISAGDYQTSLALKQDGTVVAWGNNGYGETVVPAGLDHVTAIAAGGFHSVALKDDGTVVAWGSDYGGETDVPVGLDHVTAISAGEAHSLALRQIPTTGPVLIVTASPPSAGWVKRPVTVTVRSSNAETALSGAPTCTDAGTPLALTGTAPSWAATLRTEGIHPVICSAVDTAGNQMQSPPLNVKIDLTRPTIAYHGNASPYTVDQAVHITCTAADTGGSGIDPARTACTDLHEPAFRFPIGTTPYTAKVTDLARNDRSANTSVTVLVTGPALANLAARFCTKASVTTALQRKIAAITAAPTTSDKGDREIDFYREVHHQTGKTLTPERADILIRLELYL